MTLLIYIIIFFFLFIIIFGLSIIRGIFRFLFGNSGSNNTNQKNNSRQQTSTKWYYSKKKKKVFDKSDGEYVEFEEIKEEEKKESDI